MRGNKREGITFQQGTFNNNKSKSRIISFSLKKTSILKDAQVTLKKLGHVWLNVKYNKTFNNDVVCYSMKELKNILKVLTEQELINYIKGGKK
jgi:hypothetical protein